MERVDTVLLKRTTVESPRVSGAGYITDGHGKTRVLATRSRLASGYASDELVYKCRRAACKEWEALSTVKLTGYLSERFWPYAVYRDLDVAYGFDNEDGRKALYKIALDVFGCALVASLGEAVSGSPSIAVTDASLNEKSSLSSPAAKLILAIIFCSTR